MPAWSSLTFGAFALALSLVLQGCGGPQRPPLAATTPFVNSVFDGPSHLSIVLRPRALWDDPHWGPFVKKAAKQRRHRIHNAADEQFEQFKNAEQLELFVAVSDADALAKRRATGGAFRFLFALYAVPAASNHAIVEAMTESGVIERKPHSSGAVEYALPSVTRGTPLSVFLYELPEGTWLAADEKTADVFKRRYDADREPPVPMAADENLLFAAFADAEVVRTSKEIAAFGGAFVDELRDVGIVLRSGGDGIAEIVLNYRTEDAADRSASAIRTAIDETCAEHRFGCNILRAAISDIDLSRKEATVTLRFVLSPAFLEAMLDD